MPEPTVPTTCPTCDGEGYLEEGVACKTCFTGGSLPLQGVIYYSIKFAYESKVAAELAVTKLDDLMDKCNDISEKCNDIFEIVNE